MSFDQALTKWLLVDLGTRDQAHELFDWVLDRIEHGLPRPVFESPLKEGEFLAPIDAADLDAIFLVYDENHHMIVTDFLPQS